MKEAYQGLAIEEELHLRVDGFILHMTPTRTEVYVIVDEMVQKLCRRKI